MTVGTGGVDACVMDLAPKAGIELSPGEYPGAKISVNDMETVGVGAVLRKEYEEKDAKWELPYAYVTYSLLGSGYTGVGKSSKFKYNDVTYGIGRINEDVIIRSMEKMAKDVGAYGGEMKVKHYKASSFTATRNLSGLINTRKYDIGEKINFKIDVIDLVGLGKACGHYSAVQHVEEDKIQLAPYGVKVYPARVVGYIAKQGASSRGKEVEGYSTADKPLKKVENKDYFFFTKVYVNGSGKFIPVD